MQSIHLNAQLLSLIITSFILTQCESVWQIWPVHSITLMHTWKKTILLYKHQWNTRWAFAHKQDIFTHENNVLFAKVKRSPLLWLQKPLKRTQMCSCVMETWTVPQKSLEIFGNFRRMFRNDWLVLGQLLDNLRKSLKNCLKSFHWYVYIVNRILCSTRYITCSLDSLMRIDIKLNT